MTALAIWIFFLSGLAINLHVLARMDLARLDFLDGILTGHAYYVLIPFLVFLIEGRTTLPELSLTFRPTMTFPRHPC